MWHKFYPSVPSTLTLMCSSFLWFLVLLLEPNSLRVPVLAWNLERSIPLFSLCLFHCFPSLLPDKPACLLNWMVVRSPSLNLTSSLAFLILILDVFHINPLALSVFIALENYPHFDTVWLADVPSEPASVNRWKDWYYIFCSQLPVTTVALCKNKKPWPSFLTTGELLQSP